MPILCLYHRDAEARVLQMIKGIDYERLHLSAYDDPAQLPDFIETALQAFGVATREEATGALDYSGAVIEHFSRLAGSYDTSTEWRANSEMLEWFSRAVPMGAGCLDIGTGTGLVGGYLQAYGRQVIGLDLVAGMLSQARGRLAGTVRACAETLPFGEACFDAVVLRQTLHYVDDSRCLREAYRVLASGGTLACAQVAATDAELACWWQTLKALVQPLRRRFYTDAALLRLVADAGFDITAIAHLELVRQDSWERFLVNCPGGEVGKHAVLSFLNNTPSRIAERMGMRRSAEGISYIQHWALLQARRGDTSEEQ